MKTEDLYYLAGLVDGEGTVGLQRMHAKDRFRKPYLSVSTTSPELAEWLAEVFGGSIIWKKSRGLHSQGIEWRLRDDTALELLEKLAPILKEWDKAARATNLVQKWKSLTPRNGKYTEEQAQKKLEFETYFLSLSRRGKQSLVDGPETGSTRQLNDLLE